MELSFILNAARRRWWLVALCALLGAIPGLLSQRNQVTEYQATAVVAVAPPRSPVNQNTNVDSAYIDSQVEVLRSGALLQDTADAVGLTFDELHDGVLVERRPGTDVVDVRATHGDPLVAQRVANTLVNLYLAGESDGLNRDINRRIDDKRDELTAAQESLDAANEALAVAIAEFIEDNPQGAAEPAVVDPVSASIITNSQADIDRLKDEISSLENSLLVSNSSLIELAARPVSPLPDRSTLILVGGAVAGTMMGLVLAALWAMSSTVVLDPKAVEEVLTAPVVGELPRLRALAANQASALERLPKPVVPIIDQLCIRAEALGRVDEPLTVVVVGARRHVGASTVAMAMANRYAAVHSNVVLVDADARDRTVSRLLDGGHGGILQLIRGARWDEPASRRRLLAPTGLPEVKVLGFGNDTEAKLQRTVVRQLLAAAQPEAQVVVVDGGTALGSATAIQLCQMADAVVLAVPLRKLDANLLDDISAQISRDRSHILPVITPTLSRFRPRRAKVEDKPIAELTSTTGTDAADAKHSSSQNGHHAEDSELKPIEL